MTYPNAEIIVVDNGSSDGSGERIREEFPFAAHLQNATNEGFTGGNNTGIAYALAHGCVHVLLLNNDTIVTPGFIEPLVERLEKQSDIGAVGGKIYYYPPVVGGKDKIIWYAGARQKWHLGFIHEFESEADVGQCDEARTVAYACGCLMLMRGDLVRSMGALADEFFIYWEESDWCFRAQELGYSSWYEPRSVIYHNFHSAERGKETAFYMYLVYRNFPIFAKRHFHGFKRLQFWLVYPLHIINKYRICLQANNPRTAKAILQGVVDYFKGYTGKMGLKERGLLR
jgi:GT2 family glycosyltransferase